MKNTYLFFISRMLKSFMAKKVLKKVTTVREHPMHVPVSKKNPAGITIRDQHPRRLKGTDLDREEIESIFHGEGPYF